MNRMEDIYPFILEAFDKNLTFTFPIHGTSMLPLLRTGDLVTIKKIDQELKKGDIILYKRLDNSFVLHRIRYVKKDSYTLVGDHQAVLEEGVKDFQIIGVVISYNKKNREHHMNNLRYKIYKRIVRNTIIRKIFGRIYKWEIENILSYFLYLQF